MKQLSSLQNVLNTPALRWKSLFVLTFLLLHTANVAAQKVKEGCDANFQALGRTQFHAFGSNGVSEIRSGIAGLEQMEANSVTWEKENTATLRYNPTTDLLSAKAENKKGQFILDYKGVQARYAERYGAISYKKVNALCVRVVNAEKNGVLQFGKVEINGKSFGAFNQNGAWLVSDLDLSSGLEVAGLIQHLGSSKTVSVESYVEVAFGAVEDLSVKSGGADLYLKSEVSDPLAEAGSNVVMKLSLGNEGTEAATNVEVRLELPKSWTYRETFYGVGKYDPKTQVWTIDRVEIGELAEVKIEVSLDKSCEINAMAEVYYADQEDTDSSPRNLKIVPAEDDETEIVINGCGNSSSGGFGGMESNGNLAGKIATRNFNRLLAFQSGVAPKTVRFDTNFMLHTAKTDGMIEVMEVIPQNGPASSQAVVTSPKDLIGITNAKGVFAIDYNTAKQRIGAILALITPDGSTYEHTKVICDRLSGAKLESIRPVQIMNQTFLLAKLVSAKGETDYAISFVAYQTANGFVIDRQFRRNQYQNLRTGNDVLNFQVWTKAPQYTEALIEQVLAGLAKKGNLEFAAQTAKAPQVYVRTGQYRNGKLALELVNLNSAKTMTLNGLQTKTEGGMSEAFSRTIDLPQGATAQVEIPMDGAYDIGFSIQNDQDSTQDEIYLADGAWGASIDANAGRIASFNITPNPYNTAQGLGLNRNITFTGEVKTWAAAFRTLQAGARPMDVTAYNALTFKASGHGTVKIVLEKASIQSWDQFTTTFTLPATEKEIVLPFSAFKKADGTAGMTAEDLTQVVFYIQGDGQSMQVFQLSVKDLAFRSGSFVARDEETEQPKNIVLGQNFPNPFNPTTAIQFTLPEAKMVKLAVFDMQGRQVASLINTMMNAGSHTVTFDATHLASGTYVYRLEAGQTQLIRKMTLLK